MRSSVRITMTTAATPSSIRYHLVTIKLENAISASVTPGSESIVENRSLNCGSTKVTITITTATARIARIIGYMSADLTCWFIWCAFS